MPDRFDLKYTAADGSEKRALVVHRSSIGAIERIMAFLIEHYAGAFPLWLSPTQVSVIPVADAHKEYAEGVYQALKDANIRVEFDDSNESLGKKIRAAKLEKVPYFLVIGDKEIEANNVKVEGRDGTSEERGVESLVKKLQEEIVVKK